MANAVSNGSTAGASFSNAVAMLLTIVSSIARFSGSCSHSPDVLEHGVERTGDALQTGQDSRQHGVDGVGDRIAETGGQRILKAVAECLPKGLQPNQTVDESLAVG